MIVLSGKKLMLIILCVLAVIAIFIIGRNLKNKETIPAVNLKANEKVVVIDAGHRRSRWRSYWK